MEKIRPIQVRLSPKIEEELRKRSYLRKCSREANSTLNDIVNEALEMYLFNGVQDHQETMEKLDDLLKTVGVLSEKSKELQKFRKPK